jgi:hypothetical protein
MPCPTIRVSDLSPAYPACVDVLNSAFEDVSLRTLDVMRGVSRATPTGARGIGVAIDG